MYKQHNVKFVYIISLIKNSYHNFVKTCLFNF
jgi:hypothetical protein